MKRLVFIMLIILGSLSTYSQFAPPAGQEGSTAIAADSSVIKGWANHVEIIRGYQNIAIPDMGYVTYGEVNDATGAADNVVVSLGDRGVAIYALEEPIKNGIGPDFAVFENSFSDTFLELAFVEVSSDGETYVRFPAISKTQTDEQVDGFGSVDATKIHNLAGKYMALYGTPFDLDDLKDSVNVNLNNITHVRIIDVVGTINPEFASYDSEGNIINDPYETPFASGGYDLDALAILYTDSNNEINELDMINFSLAPNPVINQLNISANKIFDFQIYDLNGILLEGNANNKFYQIDMKDYPSGVYMLKIISQNKVMIKSIIKQ